MQVVLNTTTSEPFLAYLNDPTSSLTLPYACEIDIAVTIHPTSTLAGFSADTLRGIGLVISYADPSLVNGSLVCRYAFYFPSGNVSCYQNGYDGGLSQQDDNLHESNGHAPGLFVGQYCLGTGTSESFWLQLLTTPTPRQLQVLSCLRLPTRGCGDCQIEWT